MSGKSLAEIIPLLRGRAGTKIRLLLKRDKPTEQTFEVELVRAQLSAAMVPKATEIRDETVTRDSKTYRVKVVNLRSFYHVAPGRSAFADVETALEKAREGKFDGVIVDLRGTPGGLLDQVIDVSGLFAGPLPVAGFKNSKGRLDVRTAKQKDEFDGRVMVLVDRQTGTGSEIFAGALQDYGRALIVGSDHTLGDATIQTALQTPNGNVVAITVALTILPSGRSFQREGVTSDIVIPPMDREPEDRGAFTQRQLPPDSGAAFWPEEWAPGRVTKAVIARLSERSKARTRGSATTDPMRESLEIMGDWVGLSEGAK